MPETLSFIEWNSVGFYLPENCSMSLFFCSTNPPGAGGGEFVFIWELPRELQEHRVVLPVELTRGCGKWIISPLRRGEDKGSVFNKRASEQFLGSDCCCRFPHLLLLCLKVTGTEWNFLVLLWHVFCNALLVIDCETGLRKYEVNLKRWSSFRAFLSLHLHNRIVQR